MEPTTGQRFGLAIGGLAGLIGGGYFGYALLGSYGDLYVLVGTVSGVLIGGALAGLIGMYAIEGSLSDQPDFASIGLVVGGLIGLVGGGYLGHILLSSYGDIYGFIGILVGAIIGAILLGLGGSWVVTGLFYAMFGMLQPVLAILFFLIILAVLGAICYGLFSLYTKL